MLFLAAGLIFLASAFTAFAIPEPFPYPLPIPQAATTRSANTETFGPTTITPTPSSTPTTPGSRSANTIQGGSPLTASVNPSTTTPAPATTSRSANTEVAPGTPTKAGMSSNMAGMKTVGWEDMMGVGMGIVVAGMF